MEMEALPLTKTLSPVFLTLSKGKILKRKQNC